MGNQKQNIFIADAIKIHGKKYSYDKVIFISALHKVEIVCNIHNSSFWQTPNKHIKRKHGCPVCGYINRANSKTLTNEEFINRAKAIHVNPAFDYSLVEYKSNQKVKIICSIHGIFHQLPAAHLVGKGCHYCEHIRISDTKEVFIEKAMKVHGDKYDYSQVLYKLAKTHVNIMCPEHGVFSQTPCCHTQGSGCPGCGKGGFDQTKLGYVYILSSEQPDITKIGITNYNPDTRCQQINKTANKLGINFELYWYTDLIAGNDCRKIESTILKWAGNIYQNPDNNFDGYTEAFINLPPIIAYQQIQELLEQI